MKIKSVLSYLWKLSLCGVSFFVGMAVSGFLLPLTGLNAPEMPVGVDPGTVSLYFLGSSILLAFSLSFLSGNLALKPFARWGILGALTWTVGAAGMVLESVFFMDTGAVASIGATLFTLLNFILPSFFLAGAVSWLFPPANLDPTQIAGNLFHTSIWKIGQALISYPFVYIFFGLIVQPLVSGYYTAEMYELTLPSWEQLAALQIARSTLFLSACLPVIRSWAGRRIALWSSLGGALFCLTAFMAVFTSYWFPWQMRLFHGLELLADALVYAGILVTLFRASSRKTVKSLLAMGKPMIFLLILGGVLIFPAGCSAESNPQDWVYPAPEFSAAYASSNTTITGELIISNPGDSEFPSDGELDGKMTLWDGAGEPRAGLDVYALPEISPRKSRQIASLEWDLEPGTYFLTWGAPAYGGVLSVFSVEQKDGSSVLGKSQGIRTKPTEFEPGIENCGQIDHFAIQADGTLRISGETRLPEQGCLIPLLYGSEGLVEGFPAGVCAPISDGRWHLSIPTSSPGEVIRLQADSNYRMILFSWDLRIPPSEPFEINLSASLQADKQEENIEKEESWW